MGMLRSLWKYEWRFVMQRELVVVSVCEYAPIFMQVWVKVCNAERTGGCICMLLLSLCVRTLKTSCYRSLFVWLYFVLWGTVGNSVISLLHGYWLYCKQILTWTHPRVLFILFVLGFWQGTKSYDECKPIFLQKPKATFRLYIVVP